jgi:hypothetical protein
MPRRPLRLQHRGVSRLVIDGQKFAFSRHHATALFRILHLDSRVRGNERKMSRAISDCGFRSLVRVEGLGGRRRVTWRRLRYLGRGDGT